MHMESSHAITSLEPTSEGQLIRRAREMVSPKLSGRAAARIGLSAEQWGYIERGYRPAKAGEPPQRFSPPAATLARMAHSLGITPERLAAEGQRPDAAEMLREMSPREEAPRTTPVWGGPRGIRPFIPYEIPLDDEHRARMVLPEDLTQDEADRLCGVIQSLAFAKRASA